MDILFDIIADKRVEVAERRRTMPIEALADACAAVERPTLSMSHALAGSATGIISEHKRRSPSKGWIKQDADPAVITPGYQAAGASALSILTDEKYFGGTLDDLRRARQLVSIPILRKDFIIDEYQLYEARLAGADAVLLIAAALTIDDYRRLLDKAHELQLEVLLEIHSPAELPYAQADADMVGVNNRHLGTFHTDVQTSFDMAELLPQGRVLVSESGISRPETINELRKAGYRGFLIGETFMRTADPAATLANLIKDIR